MDYWPTLLRVKFSNQLMNLYLSPLHVCNIPQKRYGFPYFSYTSISLKQYALYSAKQNMMEDDN